MSSVWSCTERIASHLEPGERHSPCTPRLASYIMYKDALRWDRSNEKKHSITFETTSLCSRIHTGSFEKIVCRVSAESIWNKPLTKAQKASLARLAIRPIDYSDIPALTDAQLREFRRLSKKLVAVRIDADVSNGYSNSAPDTPRGSTTFRERS